MSIGKNLDLILFRNSFYTFVITKIAGKQKNKNKIYASRNIMDWTIISHYYWLQKPAPCLRYRTVNQLNLKLHIYTH